MYKLDTLSPQPTFFHKSNSRYKSAFGGCLTLVNILLFTSLVIYFGFDLFVRENPEVSFSKALAPEAKIDQDDLHFSISAHLVGGLDIAEIERKLVFDLEMIYTDATKTPPSSFEKFDLLPCPQTKYYKDPKYNLSSMAIASPNSYYCPPDDLKYHIINPFGSAKFDVFNLNVSYCKDKPECYPIDFIKTNLTNLYLQVSMKDNYVDSFSFDEPLKDNFSQVMLPISSEFHQTLNVYFREITFNSEEGWIFPQKEAFKGHTFDHYSFSLATLDERQRILKFMVTFDTFKEVFNRNYIKLQDVLGQVSGTMKVVMSIFKLILEFYSNYCLSELRMNTYKIITDKKLKVNNLIETLKDASVTKLAKTSNKPKEKKAKLSITRFFMTKKFENISIFSNNYKRIFSEQNLFELCALRELRSEETVKEENAKIKELLFK